MSKSILTSDYVRETEWLFNQFPSYQAIGAKAYKPTLDNTLALVKSIGNPEKNLSFVHVAGSNGKGSTCSMLASILTEAGYTVGLFTSPHIKDYRERIRVNGECIDEQSVVDFIQAIKRNDYSFEPSFFEVTFAMALQFFKKQECDICIIETGLGGRLDSTNIITPLVSIITSISLEHTNILGDTLQEIAYEKAGIIKPNTSVVLGKLPKEVVHIFTDKVEENNCSLYTTDSLEYEYASPLLGKHQRDNLLCVNATLHALENNGIATSKQAIINGLDNLSANTGFTGRLQIVDHDPLIIFDVSHNVDGIRASIEAIQILDAKKIHIVYGTSNDKDISSILETLPKNAHCYFCEFTNERSAQLSDLKTIAESKKISEKDFFLSATNALEAAKTNAEEEDLILAIGSFFLISDFF